MLVRQHQRAVVGFAERPARGDVSRVRQRQAADRPDRRCGSDKNAAAHRANGASSLRPSATKHAAGFRPERAHRIAGIVHFGPAVAGDRGPWRPPQRDEGHVGSARGGGSVRRNGVGIGMRGVDQRVDALLRQDNRQARRRRRSRRSRTGTACGTGAAVRPASDSVTARSARARRGARANMRASVVPPRMRTCGLPCPILSRSRATLPHCRAGCPSSASARTALTA